MKRKLNKGFTLAELLIVVAIIGVLVAISIPIFNNQLKKARFATNVANARAAYAAAIAQYIDDGMPSGDIYYAYYVPTGELKREGASNFGCRVRATDDGSAIADISAWKPTTLANITQKTLSSHISKRWQVLIEDGEVAAFYAFLNLNGQT